MTEKLTGTSLDISAGNRARLKALFPSVFTETVNDKGELVESVDFEKLKAELGTFTDLFEARRERYGMDWPGKKEALRLIQTSSAATLKPSREESVNFDTTENLFIEGDNLEVLKLLQKSYYGKVKMIYIDPPYNTGKEFIYPDNYSESLETYLEYAGLIDGEGKKFSTNTANEGRFHTRWLNMMYPRLYLTRNLLRDDGVIFISIDDNEVSNLRKMCDEIFGEENFVAQLVWSNKEGGGSSDSKYFRIKHEYILCYTKMIELIELQGVEISNLERYTLYDEYLDTRGPYYLQKLGMGSIQYSSRLDYEIEAPDKTFITPKDNNNGKKACWRWSKQKYEWGLKNNFIEIKKDKAGIWIIYTKQYLKCDNNGNLIERTQRPFGVIDSYSSTQASKYLDEIGLGEYFNYSKPSELIKYITNLTINASDIILDFFAGSATTAHAVLDLNKQDSGNRKFILVQLPEPCSEDSEAFKAGYKTIADIGKERIRRVIKKISHGDAETQRKDKITFIQESNSSLFSLDTSLKSSSAATASPRETSPPDLGFKVLKLDKSNFKQWQKLAPSTPPDKIIEQLEMHIDHISPESTPEDLLYEILLKAGFKLTEKIETKILSGQNIFSVADGALLLCLEDAVTGELIDAVIAANPQQFICLDSAFHGNDQLKANAVQSFKAHNMQKEKHNQIIFKTV